MTVAIASREARWELPTGLQAAAEARRAVRAWLEKAGPELAPVADDLVLLASELAANATEHGTPPVFLILSAERGDGVTVVSAVVHDCGSWVPGAPAAELDDERHRGLVLVEALASQWGIREDAEGKDVWCELRAEAA